MESVLPAPLVSMKFIQMPPRDTLDHWPHCRPTSGSNVHRHTEHVMSHRLEVYVKVALRNSRVLLAVA